MPNIKMPTIPLVKAKYLAPLIPRALLKITGNGNPYFWEGLPIKLTKKYTNIDAIKLPNKTTNILSS